MGPESQSILVLLAILFVWLIGISAIILKAFISYQQASRDIDNKDFASALAHLKKKLEQSEKEITRLEKELRETNNFIQPHIQKLGLIRYNPFGNTGGDQSFCLALLDQNDNGILITSLHAREQTRIYTKEIKSGKPKASDRLSKEETEAIKKAQKWSK